MEEVQFHDTKIDEKPQKLHQIKKFRNVLSFRVSFLSIREIRYINK